MLEEFYALGFRNPYRFSMDPETGKIWVGDVGQDTMEEVDLLVAGAITGGLFGKGRGGHRKCHPTRSLARFRSRSSRTTAAWEAARLPVISITAPSIRP